MNTASYPPPLAQASSSIGASDSLRHLWLEITEKCNLSCVHCYAESGPHLPLSRGMEVEDWQRILHEAHGLSCSSVQFIGGEPTLHPALDFLLQEASYLGFDSIEVFTNGTALIQGRVNNYKHWGVKVATSFYSADPITHDRITKQRGSFKKTVDGITRALGNNLEVRAGIIQIDQSDTEVEEARLFLENLGVYNIGFDRVRKFGRADEPVQISTQSERMQELCGACADGKLCVTSSGETYPCIMAREWSLGNASEGLGALMNGKTRQVFSYELSTAKSSIVAGCSPDNCGPYCNPNCSPYSNCSPKCWPW